MNIEKHTVKCQRRIFLSLCLSLHILTDGLLRRRGVGPRRRPGLVPRAVDGDGGERRRGLLGGGDLSDMSNICIHTSMFKYQKVWFTYDMKSGLSIGHLHYSKLGLVM